jgi:cold shock protein
MIKLFEAKVLPDLRRDRYPDRQTGARIAQMMRAVATELEG